MTAETHETKLARHRRECLAELEKLGIYAGLNRLDAVTLDILLAQVLAAMEAARLEGVA